MGRGTTPGGTGRGGVDAIFALGAEGVWVELIAEVPVPSQATATSIGPKVRVTDHRRKADMEHAV